MLTGNFNILCTFESFQVVYSIFPVLLRKDRFSSSPPPIFGIFHTSKNGLVFECVYVIMLLYYIICCFALPNITFFRHFFSLCYIILNQSVFSPRIWLRNRHTLGGKGGFSWVHLQVHDFLETALVSVLSKESLFIFHFDAGCC